MSTAAAQRSISIVRETQTRAISLELQVRVFVIFTSMNRTLKAMEEAAQLTKPLGARIEVLTAQVVPFPLPLNDPPVSLEFVVRHLEEMAAGFPQKIRVSAYLCRDPMEAYKRVLNRTCPVVIGIRKRWWPTRDRRLARKLRRAGYDVILVETE